MEFRTERLPNASPAAQQRIFRALLGLGLPHDSGLEPALLELVKMRASQINGCAFCLRMHTRDALALGETTDRLSVVAAWWESQYFTEQEQAALTLAEDVTRLPVPDRHAWDNGSLTDEQVSAIIWLAIVMNTWNRIAIRSHTPVGP